MQGRSISLLYIQYFNEKYGSMGRALSTADSLNPTDVFISIGVWLHWSGPNCGTWGPMPLQAADLSKAQCPSIPNLCQRFRQNGKQNGKPYKLWWLTPVPSVKNDTLIAVLEGVSMRWLYQRICQICRLFWVLLLLLCPKRAAIA
jgi:hypothetical protein